MQTNVLSAIALGFEAGYLKICFECILYVRGNWCILCWNYSLRCWQCIHEWRQKLLLAFKHMASSKLHYLFVSRTLCAVVCNNKSFWKQDWYIIVVLYSVRWCILALISVHNLQYIMGTVFTIDDSENYHGWFLICGLSVFKR